MQTVRLERLQQRTTSFAVAALALLVLLPGPALAQIKRASGPQADGLPDDVFRVSYFDTGTATTPSFVLGIGGQGVGGAGDSLVRIVNPTSQPALCAMIYVFDEAEEQQECCGCSITADGFLSLSTENNLTGNPASGAAHFPTGVIKIVSSLPNTSVAGVCDPGLTLTPTPTLREWGEHAEETSAEDKGEVGSAIRPSVAVTRTIENVSILNYSPAPTDAQEFTNLVAECAKIESNGTGTGVCTCDPTNPPPSNPLSTDSACTQEGALGLLISGNNVDLYVPNSSVSEASGFVSPAPYSTTGVQLVVLEGSGTNASIPTSKLVVSCGANGSTGETACVGDDTTLYLINGTTVSDTLASGAIGRHTFSDGYCTNCGVTIDPTTDLAIISESLSSTSSSVSGYQLLDLSSNTFGTPFVTPDPIAENFGVDSGRNLILSPSEDIPMYELINISDPTTPAVYNNYIGTPTGIQFDSSAEECSTGIILASDEEHPGLYIADLTQATFTAGSPGLWSAPEQFQTLPEFTAFTQGGSLTGTTEIAVASGQHLAILDDAFGTTAFGAVQLPATSGTGTPAIQDWVVGNLPSTPDGKGWLNGYDVHFISAYVSPNNNKAYGVLVNRQRTYVALVDLAALMAAARTGAHILDSAVNLVTSNIVTYIAID